MYKRNVICFHFSSIYSLIFQYIFERKTKEKKRKTTIRNLLKKYYTYSYMLKCYMWDCDCVLFYFSRDFPKDLLRLYVNVLYIYLYRFHRCCIERT